jgi:hypothetical protein
METRRSANGTQPTSLVWAQLLLFLGAVYAVGHGMLEGRWPGWEVLIGLFALLAAYGIANEARWGWRMGLVVAVASVLPPLTQVVRVPGLALHPDVLVLLVLPVATLLCLGEASGRDYQRAWFR